jgi:two-component system phosphate regulon sensor histidine kinase PhoR
VNFNDLVNEQPLLSDIMDTILDGVVTIEHTDTFTYANAGAARIFGVSREELTNRKFGTSEWALLSEEGIPLTGKDEPFAKVHRENITISAEKVYVQRPDGSKLPVLLNIGPIELDGMGEGMVGVFTDISALTETENLRQDYQRSISHDLRTPLTVILGYSEMLGTLLRGYDLPDEVWTAIDSIRQSGTRMLAMINDLLEVARLEGHPIELDRKPVHLDRFLPSLLQDSRTPQNLNRFKLQIQPDLPPVDADPDKLRRVITNLLDNAVNYSEEYSPIVIETGATAGFVRISIQDQGKGLPPKKISTLFNRFDRGERRGWEGYGLGLYVVRLLTEAHGGHVFVCSEPEKGSTFSIYYPEWT